MDWVARLHTFAGLWPRLPEMLDARRFRFLNIFWLGIAGVSALATALLPSNELLIVCIIVSVAVAAVVTPYALLACLLVLSPLRALVATEANFAFPLDIGQLLLMVYLGAWLATRIINRRPILVGTSAPVFLASMLLASVLGIGAWTSASMSAWLREWLKWIIMAVFVWHLGVSAGKNWRWLVFALLLSATVNAIVGIYIFLGGSGADHLLIMGRFFRAFGTFGQPNPFGGFLGILLPLAVMGAYAFLQLLVEDYRISRIVRRETFLVFSCFVASSILMSSALIASWSRGAWLGIAGATGVMLFAIPKRISRGLSYSMALLLLFVGLWYGGLLPRSIVNRLTTAAGDFLTLDDIRGVDISPTNYAVMERIAHWQAALNMAEAHPVFGVGLGNYEVVYDDYRLINWKEPLGHAHNFYLNMLAEAGLAGALAYVAFWITIFALTWRIRAHPDRFARSMAIGLLGCWTYLAVHSIFDSLYVNNLFLHIGVLLGMLSILYRQISRPLIVE